MSQVSFPGHSHLQYLIAYSIQIRRGKVDTRGAVPDSNKSHFVSNRPCLAHNYCDVAVVGRFGYRMTSSSEYHIFTHTYTCMHKSWLLKSHPHTHTHTQTHKHPHIHTSLVPVQQQRVEGHTLVSMP